jgi:hypothetical protein
LTTKTCVVSNVFWTAEAGGGELQIRCDAVWYYADTNTSTDAPFCTGEA